MSEKELVKRYLLFVISLFISAIGVAVTKKGELGVSPISSVGNVLSLKFTFLTLGNWLIIWNCLLLLGQILLLRKNFHPIELLQIPISLMFGYFTDFGVWMTSFFTAEAYVCRLILVIVGTALLALGVSLSVIANVIMNSGEAFVKALSDTIHKDFANVKIAFDVGCVAASVILSLLFFGFKIEGTREGTVIAAFLTGLIVKFFLKLLKKPISRLVSDTKRLKMA